MNTDEREIGPSERDVHYEYPLDRYLVPNNARDNKIYDENNLYAFQESVSTLLKVKNILISAETTLKSMSSCLAVDNSQKIVHLKQPAYFDENFDRNNYIKELVNAKLKGCKIIQDTNATKISNILKAGQFVMNKLSQDSDRAEEIMALSANSISNKNGAIHGNTRVIEINAQTNIENDSKPRCGLSMHLLPGIDIRSQLKEQKFPPLDIQPSDEDHLQSSSRNNIVIIESKYEDPNDKIITVPVPQQSALENKPTIENFQNPNHKTKKDGLQNIAEKQSNSYVFLNPTTSHGNCEINDQTLKYSRRSFSKLRKFGIPEIANIYNPKPKLTIKKSAYPHFYRHMLELNNSDINLQDSSQTKYHNPINKTSKKPQLSSGSVKIENKNIEYIPYGKLTIGGMKPDDIKKQLSSSMRKEEITSSDTSLIIEEDTKSADIAENGDKAKDSNDSESISISQYADKFDTTESHSISLEEQSNKNLNKAPISKDKLKQKMKELKSKNKIEIFEYLHNIETKDISTQSDCFSGLYKNTQTSPQRNNKRVVKILADIDESQPNDSSESVSDIKNLTIGEILKMEKTISSFNKQLRFKANPDFIDESKNLRNKNETIEDQFMTRDTQTSPSETAFVIPSDVEPINEQLSPKIASNKVDTQTSPVFSESSKISELQKPNISLNHCNSSAEIKKANEKTLLLRKGKKKEISASSDTYTDVSQSETSDTFSLGEINLTILRKRIVRILNQNNSCSNTSSLSSNANHGVQNMDSTMSSCKSEGEISLKTER